MDIWKKDNYINTFCDKLSTVDSIEVLFKRKIIDKSMSNKLNSLMCAFGKGNLPAHKDNSFILCINLMYKVIRNYEKSNNKG